jgi:hypothetical protein
VSGGISGVFEKNYRREADARAVVVPWEGEGISAHVGDAIPVEDKKAIEDVACYIVRNPLSLKTLVTRRARMNRARLIWRDRFAIPWPSVSARRRSQLLTSERSSVCRWTTRGDRSGPAQPDTQSQPCPVTPYGG